MFFKKLFVLIFVCLITFSSFSQFGVSLYPHPLKIGIRTYLENNIIGNIKFGKNNDIDYPVILDASLLYRFKSYKKINFYSGLGIELHGKYKFLISPQRLKTSIKFDTPEFIITAGTEILLSKKTLLTFVFETNSSFYNPLRISTGIIYYFLRN